MPAPVFIFCESPLDAHRRESRDLASALDLPLLDSLANLPRTHPGAFALVRTADRLELREPASPRAHPLFVDFSAAFTAPARFTSSNFPLARALGKPLFSTTRSPVPLPPAGPAALWVPLQPPYIIDCTAGFAIDSARLLAAGASVLAVERNPVLHALILDGLRRASADPLPAHILASRFHLLLADAACILPCLHPPPAAAYIDPMFPPKRRASALPPRPAQVLQRLLGQQSDSPHLISAAHQLIPRVVIKQPPEAPPPRPKPTAVIRTKLLRYDILCNPRLVSLASDAHP